MSGEQLAPDPWVGWSLGEPVPAPGHEYVVLVQASGLPRHWTAIARVLAADNIFAARFDWPYTSTIIAYLPRRLPAFEA